MKIGNKEFTAKVNNRVIWDIEEAFGNIQISKVMTDIDSFTMKQMGTLIWHSIKSDIDFEEFADNIQINQYVPAATEVGTALGKAFDTGVKKK